MKRVEQLKEGCGEKYGGWMCTHHSKGGKTHLAFAPFNGLMYEWPIENPGPVRVEVIEIFGNIYPEWPDA